jgi:hypothetical protein
MKDDFVENRSQDNWLSVQGWRDTVARQARTLTGARTRRTEPVDYRDRISVATWPVILGLALSLFVRLPTLEFSFVAFGSPATIPLTGTVAVAFALAVLAASGAESVVSAHPSLATVSLRKRGRTLPYWALPMGLTIIITMLLTRLPTPLIQVLALLLSSGLFILAFFSLYMTVEPGQQGFRRSRLVLNLLTYAAAVVLFLFVYQTRARSLVSATLVAVTAMLLAVELLRSSTQSTATVLNYGAAVGLILGQVTWALNYWPLPNLTAGLLLLLIFYILVSFAQSGLQGRLTARVVWEFVVVAVAALILLGIFGPGFTVIGKLPPVQ